MKIDPASVIAPALTDPSLPFGDWEHLAVVYRREPTYATEDSFAWSSGGLAVHFSLDGWEIADHLERLCAHQQARVAVLYAHRSDDTAGLNLLYGHDADPWLLPPGREDDLAALVAALLRISDPTDAPAAETPDEAFPREELEPQPGTPESTAEPAPVPGTAYVPIAAATPETLRAFMIAMHDRYGQYALPFWVASDPHGCEHCRHYQTGVRSDAGNLEATVPADFLARLDGQTRLFFDREFTAYRVTPLECPHAFVVTVPDTLRFLLEPICAQVTVLDDSDLGTWISEPEDLTPALSHDDVSRIQLAAIGLDPESSTDRVALLTDVRYVTHLQIPPPPDTLGLDTEVATATAELGSTDGDLVWATDYPVRLRTNANTWFVDHDPSRAATTLDQVDTRLVFTHASGARECLLHVEALHDPHLVRRTRYLGGDTITVGPWWRPLPDEEYRIELEGTATAPFEIVEHPAALPATVTVRTGEALTGRVYSRVLRANPWNGTRYWALTLVVAEAGYESHFLRVTCPYRSGQRVRTDDHVSLDAVLWTARLTP